MHHLPLALLAAASWAAASARAVPITSLYSTGVDDAGVPLSGGSIDPHWRLTISPDPAYPGPSALVLNDNADPFFNGYVPNTLNSKWIGPRADGGHNFPRSDCTVGCLTADYHFETTFDLTGVDPGTVEILGQWVVDDSAEILLNGVSTGVSRALVPMVSWATWDTFTISSGFAPGINTLTVVVRNHFFPNSNLSDNAVGMHMQLSATASIPEPASLLLLIFSTVALPRARRNPAPV